MPRPLLCLVVLLVASSCVAAAGQRPLPEFTSHDPADWLNSEPLSVADLRGQVVLVDVWTFDCWNCYRSFAWLKSLESRLAAEPFRVIGIHSPEFEHEKDAHRVAVKVTEFGLTHPVMLDNRLAYWRALGNRYWPAFYLVDKQGLIRHLYVGETHRDDARARRIEHAIRTLLAE